MDASHFIKSPFHKINNNKKNYQKYENIFIINFMKWKSTLLYNNIFPIITVITLVINKKYSDKIIHYLRELSIETPFVKLYNKYTILE